MNRMLALVVFLFISIPVWAVEPIEERAQKLDKQLIAPCCWTATLDEHFSDVAVDMKGQIRQMLAEGKSEDQILQFFEKKYGERVLSEPKTSGFNLVVWVFPFVILIVGSTILWSVLNRRLKKKDEPTHAAIIVPISPEADEKYRKMIDQELYRSE